MLQNSAVRKLIVIGGTQNDIIQGGPGNDVLTGGLGNDTVRHQSVVGLPQRLHPLAGTPRIKRGLGAVAAPQSLPGHRSAHYRIE